MRELGIDAFRFSIAWPRILPNGRGAVNAKGLDFYDRLVDELLGNGIEPFVTLFHWDTPQVLEDAGGWPSRDIVDAFAEYVEAVGRAARRSGGALDHAQRAVGRRLDRLRLGPSRAGPHVRRRRARDRASPAALARPRGRDPAPPVAEAREVGITLNLDLPYAVSDDPEDVAAARWVDGLHNRWFLDPLFRGEYPADMLEAWQDLACRRSRTAT